MSFLTVSNQDNADYENWLAGGGNLGPQQQVFIPEVHVEVVQPPTDYTLLIVTGVVVPLLIAAVGWWLRKKAHKE